MPEKKAPEEVAAAEGDPSSNDPSTSEATPGAAAAAQDKLFALWKSRCVSWEHRCFGGLSGLIFNVDLRQVVAEDI
jgi:hypothetical protein